MARRVPRPVVLLAVLFLLGCAAALILFRSLDATVKSAIEREGPAVTGTRVRVGGVHLGLREGRGELHDLRIANPEGFSDADAVTLGEVVLDVDTGSLGKAPLRIDEIRVTSSSLRLELDARGGSNLERIRRSVQDYAPMTRTRGAAPRVAVQRLVFEGTKVQVDAGALGGRKSEWTLGDVTLTGLGGRDGVPADELAKVALERLVREATKKAATREIEDAAGRSLGKSAADVLGGLFGKKD